MSEECFKLNALNVPGTRQDERMQQALQPGYVKPDERSIGALMVFISRYAELIRYYTWRDESQQEYMADGNWKPLIMSSEAFHYAGIAITPSGLPNITFYKWAARYEKGSTQAARFAGWRVMWDILFSVYRDIDAFYNALPTGMALRSAIGSEISHHLTAGLMNATARYLNAAEAEMVPVIAEKGVAPAAGQFVLFQSTSPDDDGYKFGYADHILSAGFNAVWIQPEIGSNSWPEYYDVLWAMNTEAQYDIAKGFTPDFYGDDGLIGFDRIDYATLQIRQLFEQAFGAYSRIIQLAADFFADSLEKKHDHQAHHALMLAFLKLFSKLQDQLNEYTRHHLEYYYERVLQLNAGKAVPDVVHVWVQPAKNVETHLLKKGTRLQAGKDAGGKPLYYDTDEDLTISKAEISSLRTIYFDPVPSGTGTAKVYASADAKSTDGNGRPPGLMSWKAFGDRRIDAVTNSVVNAAPIGFCIAAPVLHLTAGTRVITLHFFTNTSGYAKAYAWSVADLRNSLTVEFTGMEGWNPLQLNSTNFSLVNEEADQFKFIITLPDDFPAITSFGEKVKDDKLPVDFPAVRLLFLQSGTIDYEQMAGIGIQQLNIDVTVTGIASLAILGGQGKFDPSGPFQPFGPMPSIGSYLYIGHPELAHKKLKSVNLKLQWQDYNGSLKSYYDYIAAGTTTNYLGITANSDFKVKWDLLRNKTWVPLNSTQDLFGGAETTMSKTNMNIAQASDMPKGFDEVLPDWSTQSRDGFLRLSLSGPANAFGHKVWPNIFAKQSIINNPPNFSTNTLPNPPYVPVVNGISIGYTATQTIQWNNTDDGLLHFYHRLPFGYREINSGAGLMPIFSAEVKNEDGTMQILRAEAALFIGISSAVALGQISLLLQMDEGSEDISVDPPDVHWNYLSQSGWKHFGHNWQADDTDGLLRSGIVRFVVPADAGFETLELPAGPLWIAAWVQHNPDGLPQATDVHIHTVKATLVEAGVHASHFEKSLPAGEIKKLFNPDAAVKKIHQPYPSFGGKQEEAGDSFYTRVSERLRHKNRAVTIWDYERLVLHEFPEVYMIKCLNHTGYTCAKGDDLPKYRENLPGQVMLIPIPFANRVQASDLFQPVFSQAMLSRIKAFIRGDDAASSCKPYKKALHTMLAQLHVENPAYETITVQCNVRFRDCLDPFVYREQLHQDLNGLLSPWISGDPSQIHFGGSLHVSVLVYFMEQLHYVDHVEQVSMQHRLAGNNQVLNSGDHTLAVATTSRSVLTSSDQHTINLITV